jgi:sugar lactone lactonase YvrE
VFYFYIIGAKEQIVSMEDVIDGVRPKLPNSVAVSSDGTIYWTDSDSHYALHDGVYTILVDGTGRLEFIKKYLINHFYFLI